MHSIEIVCRIYTNLEAGFLLSSFFDPEDGDELFPRNVGCVTFIPEDWTLHRRLFYLIKEVEEEEEEEEGEGGGGGGRRRGGGGGE
jgi:hypothetical protein